MANSAEGSARVSAIPYDVQDPLPFNTSQSADIIVMDPPWYHDYYKIFLSRAQALLKIGGGLVLFPIFPPLTKAHARTDLADLRQDLNERGCTNVQPLFGVRYSTPRFERLILKRLGAPIPLHDWRHCLLYSMKLRHNDAYLDRQCEIERHRWSRFTTHDIDLLRAYWTKGNVRMQHKRP